MPPFDLPFQVPSPLARLNTARPTPATRERRDSYRVELRPGQAAVRVADGGRATIQDLSATGGSFLLHGIMATGQTALRLELNLGNGEWFQTDAKVVRRRASGEGMIELGARFGELGTAGLTKLSRFITDEHLRRTSDPSRLLTGGPSLRVDNPLFIANLFTPLAELQERRLLVIDGRLRLPTQLLVEGTEFQSGRRLVRARLIGAGMPFEREWPYTFVLSGIGAVTVFQSSCVKQDGHEVLLTIPAEVRQTGFRQSPRVSLPPSASATVTVAHPRIPGARLGGQLTDVAGGGVSFEVDAANHALFPGDRLPGVELSVPDGRVEATGVVRGIAGRQGSASSCGVELTAFASRADAERWHRFVLGNSHPNLFDIGRDAQAAWGVLERSRYIDLWTPPAHREHVRQNFFATWQRPSVLVGNSLGLDREGAPVGISAGSLAYPGTWILHHLGIESGASAANANQVMRQASELITGLLYRLRDIGDMEHFVIYAEKGKRWNERLYTDFAARYADRDKLVCSGFRVYRRLTEVPSAPGLASTDLQVVPATPDLWAQLASENRRSLPAIEQHAYAYGPEQIDLQAFSRSCQQRGYERARTAFFACAQGRPVAAAIVETGNEGANVFGLLNTCRLVPLGSASLTEEVRRSLLDRVLEHYRAAGKKSYLLFDASGEEDPFYATLGYETVSAALRLLAHKDVIPAWTAYLRGLLNTLKTQRRESAELAPSAAAIAE